MATMAEIIGGTLKDDLARVEEELRAAGRSKIQLIPDIFYHTLGAGGKRMRPALALLAGRVCGEINDRSFEVAAATELIHLASLLHDDVIDAARLRRGRPTANVIWGNKASILVADYLFAMAFTLLTRHPDPHVVQTMAVTVDRMCEGELAQLENERELGLTEEKYLEMIADKTGALIAAACEMGAHVVGANVEQCRLLREFGMRIGTAFQMADDLMDLLAAEEEIGKPVGNDIRCGRLTLPLIYTLQKGNGSLKGQFCELLSRDPVDDETFLRIRAIVHQSGGVAYAQRTAQRLIDESKPFLLQLPPCEARQQLADLADYVLARTR